MLKIPQNRSALRRNASILPGVLAVLLCVLITLEGAAQLSTAKPVHTPVDNLIPPSPEASALGKYTTVPVGLYTGVPQVSIPLWQLTEGDISIPISMSYHAGGNKVEEITPRTGLGWTLNAGGVISRTIMGEADEYGFNGFIHFSMNHDASEITSGPASSRFPILYNLINCEMDAQPDQFTFNFQDYSGKFAFNWSHSIEDKIDISSDKKVSIKPVDLNLDPYATESIKAWEATAADGTKYLFEAQESNQLSSQSGFFFPCRYDRQRVTSWYLTRITSATGHSVFFEYTPYNLQYTQRSSETVSHRDRWEPGTTSFSYEKVMIKGKYLSKITTGSGNTTIVFRNSVTARTDLPAGNTLYSLADIEVLNKEGKRVKQFTNTYTNNTGRLTLERIQELGEGFIVKPPYKFQYSGTLPSFSQLQTVSFNNQDHWGFLNGNTASTLLPSYTAKAADGTVIKEYPGAYRGPSGASAGSGILVKITYPTGGTTSFEYEPHSYSFVTRQRVERTYATIGKSAGVVHQSVYTPAYPFRRQGTTEAFTVGTAIVPEEGITFTFTGSYCSNDPGTMQSEWGPGAEITDANGTRIEGFTYSHSQTTKSMKLTTTQLRPGQVYYLTASTIGDECIEGGHDQSSVSVSWKEYTNTVISSSETAGGFRIKRITDHDGVDASKDIIRRFEYTMLDSGDVVSSGVILNRPVYEFDTWMCESSETDPFLNKRLYLSRMSASVTALGNTMGSHIGYRKVTTFYGQNGEGGKTESWFTSFYNSPDYVSTGVPFPPPITYDYKRGKLLTQIDYKRLAPNQFKEVKRIENQYDNDFSGKQIRAFKAGLVIGGGGPHGETFIERYQEGGYAINLAYQPLVFTRETITDDLGMTFTIEKRFQFDPQRQFLLSTTNLTSDGKELTTEYYYPWRYANGGRAFIDQLKQNHILSPAIETVTTETVGGTTRVIDAGYTEYSAFGNTLLPSRKLKFASPAPVTDLRLSLANAGNWDTRYYTEQQVFNRYNVAAKPEQVTSPGDLVTAYIWGYGNSLPVAQTINATADQVAYSGFESSPLANWGYVDVAANYSIDAKTGARSFRSDVTVSLSAGRHVVSLWAKGSGSISVNGSPKNIDNTWKRYQWTVDHAGSVSITVNFIGNLIDDVRIHPEAAKMKTFTYIPAVGMRSMTDENHITTYYEYDGLGRLIAVKDFEGNIVKTYSYNYKQN